MPRNPENSPRKSVEADSGSPGGIPTETDPVGSPVSDERDPGKGRGAPDLGALARIEAGRVAAMTGEERRAERASAAPAVALASWSHSPDPDGGTRCGKPAEGRDVLPLRRRDEATCPDCRAVIDGRRQPGPAPRFGRDPQPRGGCAGRSRGYGGLAGPFRLAAGRYERCRGRPADGGRDGIGRVDPAASTRPGQARAERALDRGRAGESP